jgi:pyruvate dehydrogenase E2 component (dihydrolipoamide acetyltransferase)
MSEVINMPKLGFDMQEGTLVRWVKNIGDSVTSGDVIAEIETDKATVEVEAYATGTILKLFVEENSIVEVGAPIAVIGKEGEAVPDSGDSTPTPKAETAAPEPQAASETAATTPSKAAAPSGNGSSGNGYPTGVKASPLARRMAEEQGINLSNVSGSGPGGRIVKRDIEGFEPGVDAPAAPVATRGTPSAAPVSPFPSDGDVEEIELSRMRKIVGERTQASFQYVPHFFVTTEIDMAESLKLRKEINASLDDEHKVTVNDLIVKATALTLRQFPNLNTHFHGDRLARHKRINIGIAVALENGLINVVCHDADRRTLSDIAVKNKDMISNAREGRVKPDDVEGATFTVSNLGAYDVDHFLAIINPPEAGILAVGSAKEIPIVVDGQITIGVRMKATVSVDHRVSDGAEGAKFLQYLKELLENPMRLLI